MVGARQLQRIRLKKHKNRTPLSFFIIPPLAILRKREKTLAFWHLFTYKYLLLEQKKYFRLILIRIKIFIGIWHFFRPAYSARVEKRLYVLYINNKLCLWRVS